MADVQIQQTPSSDRGLGWLWAVIAIVAIAVLAWFLFAGGRTSTTRNETKVDISTPAGNASGSATTPSGGTTKTP